MILTFFDIISLELKGISQTFAYI